jgi:hypothetical protein
MWTVKWFLASLSVTLITNIRPRPQRTLYIEYLRSGCLRYAAFALLCISKTRDPEPERNHGVLIKWLQAEMFALILQSKLLCHQETRAQNIFTNYADHIIKIYLFL